ncbi:MAG TPA: molybdopterin-dependent oxidoreductase [Coriobacteriia bacterium]
MDRRGFLTTAGRAGALLLAGSGTLARSVGAADDPILAGRPLVRYPEKTDLILLTARPPQLETPMKYFDRAITPNEAFFVRYHIFPIPTSVDLATWRLRVHGRVDRPLELSMEDLKTKFPPAKVVAVNQCSGNSRGRFAPRVLGGEWGDGAMGNAEWVGVRMRTTSRCGREAAPRSGRPSRTRWHRAGRASSIAAHIRCPSRRVP